MNYTKTAGNWRLQLLRNERKTRMVIGIFILIYAVLGFLVDILLAEARFPGYSTDVYIHALLQLKIFPYATFALLAVAGISLLVMYAFHDRLMLLGTEYREITPHTATNLHEKQLYNVVEEMKVAAGLHFMPKVYLIEADYMNAFASGYSEKSAMVAITRGLMEKLDRAELTAVMAHELSHIRHHDIKLTLTVAVLSNLILMVIDVIFYSIIYSRDDRGKRDNRLVLIVMILRYALPIITVLLALFLSRTREYMADAGSVELMRDNDPMARALLKIAGDHEAHADVYQQQYGQTPHEEVRRASYLFDPSTLDPVKSFSSLFATHPSIPDRLKAIGFKLKTPKAEPRA